MELYLSVEHSLPLQLYSYPIRTVFEHGATAYLCMPLFTCFARAQPPPRLHLVYGSTFILWSLPLSRATIDPSGGSR